MCIKKNKCIYSFLTAIIIALGIICPSAIADADNPTAIVIIENTTYSKSDGSPWDGRILEKEISIQENCTMQDVLLYVSDNEDVSLDGADYGYISGVNGLYAYDGGDMSGWMCTLNDWFTDKGISDMSVNDGDIICLAYTRNWGDDLGSSWSNNITTLKSIEFSSGVLNTSFSSDSYDYTLIVPAETKKIIITPTAVNKNFQTMVYEINGEPFLYKRTQEIPINDGDTFKIGCGLSDWATMNSSDGGHSYNINIKLADNTDISGDNIVASTYNDTENKKVIIFSDTEKSYDTYIAAYSSDGKLIQTKYTKFDASNKYISVSYADISESGLIKVFAWDSMKPIIKY